jgi:hypothetical protein
MVQGAIRKLLEDVTEDESFVTVGDSPNHICWQTGHLLFTAAMRLQALGQKADIPREWVLMFGRGAKHPGGRSAFPLFVDLRTTLFSTYVQADKTVADTTNEYLDSEIAIFPTWKDRAYPLYLLFLDARPILRRTGGDHQAPFGSDWDFRLSDNRRAHGA